MISSVFWWSNNSVVLKRQKGGFCLISRRIYSSLYRIPGASLDYPLCFWLTACRPGTSKTPSMCLINLLKWLTELRETFYLLAHQFLIEIYTLLRNSHCKRCTGQDMEKGLETFMPFPHTPLFPNPQVFTNPEVLQAPSLLRCYGNFITKACLITSLGIGDYFNL